LVRPTTWRSDLLYALLGVLQEPAVVVADRVPATSDPPAVLVAGVVPHPAHAFKKVLAALWSKIAGEVVTEVGDCVDLRSALYPSFVGRVWVKRGSCEPDHQERPTDEVGYSRFRRSL
jgi:hypothetical protein